MTCAHMRYLRESFPDRSAVNLLCASLRKRMGYQVPIVVAEAVCTAERGLVRNTGGQPSGAKWVMWMLGVPGQYHGRALREHFF
jgi:hypothetical protein